MLTTPKTFEYLQWATLDQMNYMNNLHTQPMPEIEHNGPGFKYRVYWKREDVDNARWKTEDVVDWEQDHFVVPNQPTFKPYRLKVEAHNDRGEANVAAPEIQGWSGEAGELEAMCPFW